MASEETVKSSLTPENEVETASIVANEQKGKAVIDDSAEDAVRAIRGAIEKRDDSPNEC